MIYLDNGATSWPKPASVLKEVNRCLKSYAANPGRSGHSMAVKASEAVYQCRSKIASLVNIDNPERVIFTSNATNALNVAIKGAARAEGHIIITSMEHNSVLRPVHALGIQYDIAEADIFGYVNPKAVESLIRDNTCLIVCTLASNVCGSVQPFKEIAKIAQKYSIPFLLDASQGLGAIEIDMSKDKIDMLAAPGHKGLYGPTGTGILCINRNIKLKTIIEGGTGSNSKDINQPRMLPDNLESGTLNIVGIAGLKKGVEFVKKAGIENIGYKERRLAAILADDFSVIRGVNLAGYNSKRPRIGVVSMLCNNIDCVEFSQRLSSEYGIATRAGYHCSYIAHQTIGTDKTGTVRFSLGAFNTIDDIKKAAYAVNKICKSW